MVNIGNNSYVSYWDYEMTQVKNFSTTSTTPGRALCHFFTSYKTWSVGV